MGNVLGNDKEVVEAVFFLQFSEIGKDFAHQVFGFAVNAEAVLELVVIFSNRGVVFGRQHAGGEDGHFLVFGQERHGCQGGLGTHRAANEKIGLFVQNQFFNRQKGLAHGDAGLQVPGVDDLHLKGAQGAFDVHPSLGVDFLDSQLYTPFRIPAIQKGGGERAPDDDRLFRQGGRSGKNNHQNTQQYQQAFYVFHFFLLCF